MKRNSRFKTGLKKFSYIYGIILGGTTGITNSNTRYNKLIVKII